MVGRSVVCRLHTIDAVTETRVILQTNSRPMTRFYVIIRFHRAAGDFMLPGRYHSRLWPPRQFESKLMLPRVDTLLDVYCVIN